jgi:hypothetical protein
MPNDPAPLPIQPDSDNYRALLAELMGPDDELVEQEPPERTAEKEWRAKLEAWDPIRVVGGKFPDDWQSYPDIAEAVGVPLSEFSRWWTPILAGLFARCSDLGPRAGEPELLDYLYQAHGLAPERACVLALEDLAGLLRGPPPPKSIGTPAATKAAEPRSQGLTKQEAAERLEHLRLRAEPFTSYRKLGNQIGAHHEVVRKAIKASPTLSAWAAPDQARFARAAAKPRPKPKNDGKPDHDPKAKVPDRTAPSPLDQAAVREYLERPGHPERWDEFFRGLRASYQVDFLDPDHGRKLRTLETSYHKKVLLKDAKDATERDKAEAMAWFFSLSVADQLSFLFDRDESKTCQPRV